MLLCYHSWGCWVLIDVWLLRMKWWVLYNVLIGNMSKGDDNKQHSLSHCPSWSMPINTMYQSKSWHWSEIPPNTDHWDQYLNFDRHWLVWIGHWHWAMIEGVLNKLSKRQKSLCIGCCNLDFFTYSHFECGCVKAHKLTVMTNCSHISRHSKIAKLDKLAFWKQTVPSFYIRMIVPMEMMYNQCLFNFNLKNP